METGWGAQRVVRVSQNDASDTTIIAPFDIPEGWIIAPPLVYDGILVAFDSGNGRIAATRVAKNGTLDILWEHPFRNLIQPMVYQDTRELVISDEREIDGQLSDDVVVLDLDTGAEKGRSTIGVRGHGMFFCPGWQRDFYYCSWFSVARLHVEAD